MSKYHVNPATGKPSACGATQRCPFGGQEDHYKTRAEAQAAYERKQQAQEVPAPAKKASDPNEGYRQRDLRVVVRTTTDEAMLTYAARTGDEGVLRELVQNPQVSLEQLQEAYPRVQNEKTQELFEAHPHFAGEVSTLISTPARWGELMKLVEHQGSDRLVKTVVEQAGVDSPLQRAVLMSGNSNISHGTKALALQAVAQQTPGTLPREVVASKNFDLQEYMGELPPRQQEWVATTARKPETLSRLSEVVRADLEREPRDEEAHDVAVAIYRNDYSSDGTRRELREASPAVASFHKLAELGAHRFPEFDSFSYQHVEGRLPDGSGEAEEVYTFDPAEVKRLGLGEGDLRVYLRHFRSQFLEDTSYDSKSGTFRGRSLF